MRKLLLLTLLVPAALPAAAPAQAPRLSADLATCHTGTDPADRYAVFTASMPALEGTDRMSMRFDLLERRPPSTAFAEVSVPRWGRWEKSRPARPGFIFSRRVGGLLAPAAYKAVVRFRWYDADGRLQRAARRVTALCRQQDPRADLQAGAVAAEPGAKPGLATYTFPVTNAGKGPAGPFDVVLTVNGVPQPAHRLGGLDPGERQLVTIAGPQCRPGSTVRIALDARSEVEETDEANDVVDAPCPPAQV